MSIDQIVNELSRRSTSDSSVDYILLEEIMSIIQTIYPIILGFIATVILMIIPIVTTLEIIYICFPVIREFANDLLVKIEGKGKAQNVLGFVLRDARKAVTIANTRMVGEHSALWIYLKLKSKSLIIASLLIAAVLILATDIIDIIMNLVKSML